MNALRPLALTAFFAALLLAGCHVTSNKNGKNDNVNIGTPFGSMSVKTNGNVDSAATGLTAYPGATPVKEDGDKDAADVNMNFGSFHLGVKVASYQTPDQQDKVLAFYRKDLARYGEVIECKDDKSVGQPTATSQGLTCTEQSHNHINTGTVIDTGIELRAGSPTHQHIVSAVAKNGGTKIGLILLNLPSGHSNQGGSKSE